SSLSQGLPGAVQFGRSTRHTENPATKIPATRSFAGAGGSSARVAVQASSARKIVGFRMRMDFTLFQVSHCICDTSTYNFPVVPARNDPAKRPGAGVPGRAGGRGCQRASAWSTPLASDAWREHAVDTSYRVRGTQGHGMG